MDDAERVRGLEGVDGGGLLAGCDQLCNRIHVCPPAANDGGTHSLALSRGEGLVGNGIAMYRVDEGNVDIGYSACKDQGIAIVGPLREIYSEYSLELQHWSTEAQWVTPMADLPQEWSSRYLQRGLGYCCALSLPRPRILHRSFCRCLASSQT